MRFAARAGFAFLLLAAALAVTLAMVHALSLQRQTRVPESDPPPGGRFVETSLGPVHVLEWGAPDAPPVLLLHGTAAWSGLWRETGEALAAEGWRAVAMDMPPFGFSPHREGADYARPVQARRVLEVAAALGRPVLLAHSIGAGPGAEALVRQPDAFSGAVLVAPAVGLGVTDPPPAALGFRPLRLAVASLVTHPALTRIGLRGFVHRKDAATEEVADVLREPLDVRGLTAGVADWLPTLLGAGPDERSRMPEGWAALETPLALIWGREDGVTPLAQGKAIQRLVPGTPLIVLEDVGHIPQVESPEAFREALFEALGAIGVPPARPGSR